jgi:hypothetical protein
VTGDLGRWDDRREEAGRLDVGDRCPAHNLLGGAGARSRRSDQRAETTRRSRSVFRALTRLLHLARGPDPGRGYREAAKLTGEPSIACCSPSQCKRRHDRADRGSRSIAGASSPWRAIARRRARMRSSVRVCVRPDPRRRPPST